MYGIERNGNWQIILCTCSQLIHFSVDAVPSYS